MSECQLIFYACPTGVLADQIERYLHDSQVQCGVNSAHKYMPHCTLTGFFRDASESISLYLNAIRNTLVAEQKYCPTPVAQISQLHFNDNWYGLAVNSPWFLSFTQEFASRAISPTRQESLRLKDWLHVSLAYDFDLSHAETLKQLALQQVDPTVAVGWEFRFYERSLINEWTCHGRWTL